MGTMVGENYMMTFFLRIVPLPVPLAAATGAALPLVARTVALAAMRPATSASSACPQGPPYITIANES